MNLFKYKVRAYST